MTKTKTILTLVALLTLPLLALGAPPQGGRGILPNDNLPPFPPSCNPQALATLTLELLDQPPTIIPPIECIEGEVASVCQSRMRVEALAASLAEEQALLSLKLRVVALARRCL